MNQLLNFHHYAIQQKNKTGRVTADEITDQPTTWKKVQKKVLDEFGSISSFLNQMKDEQELQIILTGAGSSAYIGDLISGTWLKSLKKPVKAVPTTDLITHFDQHVISSKPLLLISFARSGNSPESEAVIDIANRKCSKVFHFIITCNSKGELANLKDSENIYIFLLPPKAEDKGLAMTNSFTSMTLSALIIPKLLSKETNLEGQINILSAYAKKIIDDYTSLCFDIAQADFKRIVFLGSGSLWGSAKESHLKVQELTNGKVVGKFDSFLGFRHGPKAIINDQTLLVYLLSNNKQTRRYENDLLEQIAGHDINLTTLGISETNDISPNVDFSIHLADQSKLEEDFWAVLSVLPAQIIGLYKSLLLGYNPDNPSANGTISRVVEGVTIYEDEEFMDKKPVAE